MNHTTINPLFTFPKQQLKEGEGKQPITKPKPSVIPVGTVGQIRDRALRNLAHLKLSKLSPIAIKFMADNLANRIGRPKIKRPEWTKDVPSPNWNTRTGQKGRDIVKSAVMPMQFWAEKRTASKIDFAKQLGRSRRKQMGGE